MFLRCLADQKTWTWQKITFFLILETSESDMQQVQACAIFLSHQHVASCCSGFHTPRLKNDGIRLLVAAIVWYP